MTRFAGFLKNVATQEDFVAPVEAADHKEALAMLASQYPQPGYLVLTCYEVAGLEKILADLKRWPGVASTVQPTLEETLSRVTARVGALPPLMREKPQKGRVESVKSAEIDAMVRLMDEQRRQRQARLEAALNGGKVAKPVAADSRSEAAAPAPKAAPQPAPKAPLATTMAASQTANSGKSVLEVLRAMKA